MHKRPLERVAPESVGLASLAIERFLDTLEASGAEMHGLMIIRHGKVAAEGWWSPYAPGIRHGCQSLTKTYAATAVGLAVDEGLVRLEDRVVEIFPEYVPPQPSEHLLQMTVRDVLRMGTGMVSMPHIGDPEWIRGFFAIPVVHAPGTAFYYNSAGSSLLGAIVRKLTGQGLIDYLTPRLFDIIGIDAANLKWLRHADGLENGGGGLFATTEDNARLMLLYLQQGVWEGKQVLSREWVRQATSRQIESREDPGIPDCKLGYGFQLWMCRPQGVYRADGAFGQYSIVFPELDMVVAISETAALGAGAQRTLDIVWDTLLPAVGAPLPDAPAAHDALRERLSRLALPRPRCNPSSPLLEADTAWTFQLQENTASLDPGMYALFTGRAIRGIETLSLALSSQTCRLSWQVAGEERELLLGLDGMPRLTTYVAATGLPEMVLASGAWSADDVFEADIRFIETCFRKVITIAFERDRVRIRVADTYPGAEQMLAPVVDIVGQRV
jgi:CubicO group peptidase (beta-lactamase class C family)